LLEHNEDGYGMMLKSFTKIKDLVWWKAGGQWQRRKVHAIWTRRPNGPNPERESTKTQSGGVEVENLHPNLVYRSHADVMQMSLDGNNDFLADKIMTYL
jgi:hypothetical protein